MMTALTPVVADRLLAVAQSPWDDGMAARGLLRTCSRVKVIGSPAIGGITAASRRVSSASHQAEAVTIGRRPSDQPRQPLEPGEHTASADGEVVHGPLPRLSAANTDKFDR